MKNIAKALKERLHYIVYGIFLAIHAFNLIPVIRYGDDYYYSMFFRRGISSFGDRSPLYADKRKILRTSFR